LIVRRDERLRDDDRGGVAERAPFDVGDRSRSVDLDDDRFVVRAAGDDL
jgi:hypothetical protein